MTPEPTPLTHPNPFQRKVLAHVALHAARKRSTPVLGTMAGWGTGKTACIPAIAQMLAEIQPGVSGAIVYDTMGRYTSTAHVELTRYLPPLGWHWNGSSTAPHWTSPAYAGRRATVWVRSWVKAKADDRSKNSLEGLDVGWLIIDECNVFLTQEVATAALGRVRAGPTPMLILMGKPSASEWWLRFARDRPGGVAFRASSLCNRDTMIAMGRDFDGWLAMQTERDRQENIFCNPQAPEGAVYGDWLSTPWPDGNLAPEGWCPPDGAMTYWSQDFGVRHPCGLIITHDPDLDADVVWGDVAPDEVTTSDVCRQALRLVWPAAYGERDGMVPLHRGCGDRAGRNRRTDLTTDFDDVARRPEDGGLGIHLRCTDAPERVDILNGVQLVQRLIRDPHDGERRLLCCPRLWRAGLDARGRSFAKSMLGYQWATGSTGATPRKDGVHDHHADALRYHVVNWRWPASDIAAAALSQVGAGYHAPWHEALTQGR